MQPGTNQYLADSRDGWSSVDVPPGRYEILLIADDDLGVGPRIGPIDVRAGRMTPVSIPSGISLVSEHGLPAPERWFVARVGDDDPIAGRGDGWGTAPLPIGRYRVIIPTADGMAQSEPVFLQEGDVATVDVAQLGVGHVTLRTTAPDSLRIAFGGNQLEYLLQLGDERYALEPEADGRLLDLWMDAGEIAFEARSGWFVDRQELDVVAGRATAATFEPARSVERLGLSLARLEFAENGPRPDRLTTTDRLGVRTFMSGDPPREGGWLLAPGAAQLRARFGDVETVVGPLPVGEISNVTLEPPPAVAAATSVRSVDVVLQTPSDGAVVDPETSTIEVVGHASTTAAAGATRIVLLVDVSGSTHETSGSDLDRDGAEETILEAEIEAALRLVDGLESAEAESPGTAFELAVIAFSDLADLVVPLSPVTDAEAMTRARTRIADLEATLRGGDTYYDRAFDAAREVLARSPGAGPSVVLLVTDGKPTGPRPALDAAGRLGLAGSIVHAIGLGPDFAGANSPAVSFPPVPTEGVAILAALASLGQPGGRTWPLARPAEIVEVVDELPIAERADARLDELLVQNTTLGQAAARVDVSRDGAFVAEVPVRFAGDAVSSVNVIEVVARAGDDALVATDRVRVQAEGFEDDRIAAEEAKRLTLEEEIEELRAALVAAQQQASRRSALESLVAELREQLDAARHARSAAEDRLAAAETSLETAIDDLEERNAALEDEMTDKAQELAQLRERAADAASRAARLEDELRDAHAQTAHRREREQAAAARLANAEQELGEARRRLAALERERATAGANNNRLVQQCRAARSQCEADLAATLDEVFQTDVTPEAIVLTVPGDVLFDFDTHTIRADAEEALRLAGLYIDQHPRSCRGGLAHRERGRQRRASRYARAGGERAGRARNRRERHG